MVEMAQALNNLHPAVMAIILILMVVLFVLWTFLPFAIFGIKSRLDRNFLVYRQILGELQKLNGAGQGGDSDGAELEAATHPRPFE